jgi:hypothetical protein
LEITFRFDRVSSSVTRKPLPRKKLPDKTIHAFTQTHSNRKTLTNQFAKDHVAGFESGGSPVSGGFGSLSAVSLPSTVRGKKNLAPRKPVISLTNRPLGERGKRMCKSARKRTCV